LRIEIEMTIARAWPIFALSLAVLADRPPGQVLQGGGIDMKRIQFIEIADEPWCPRAIRHGVTDYCRFVTEVSGAFNAIAPLLAGALKKTGARRVLDLGSGSGGPRLRLQSLLRQLGVDMPVCLSDHNPNIEAFERARRLSQGAITYHAEPVDAAQVPGELTGFRTFFSAFHHLRPDRARAALADAAAKGQGIAVFDWTRPSIFVFPLLLGTPLRVLLVSPFIRPFRWSRLFWTYLVPALPLVLLFDTVVSLLRVYSVQELRDLTAGLDRFHWEVGTVRAKPIPVRITYLIGVPIESAA
jgi:SAM-dependent methyltransferase